jgi:hypothetical protein
MGGHALLQKGRPGDPKVIHSLSNISLGTDTQQQNAAARQVLRAGQL